MELDSGKFEKIANTRKNKKIKSWKFDACPRRIGETYIQQVGFIN